MDRPQEIRLSPTFGYWDRVRAALVLIVERPWILAMALLWPLAGLGLLAFAWSKGSLFTGEIWLAALLAMLFVPMMVLLNTAFAYFGHRQSREPFVYLFDADGVHVSATTYEYTHKWPAIFKVKRSAGFLMFFFSPGCAHCIPLRAIADRATQADLVAMAAAHGADVRGA
ncbi:MULTISPECIES: YcxB family protein [Bacteria]|uniref:YcxB-like C-terminal domain-containing protein n=1 Tax=Lysobacter enzymogenes TaxID=69 RepID=A0AAU9AKL9_LYSEN|nr:YcxB family protein [Lysobacter enzymogenes]BAV96215.1 hypothetical protein LEN_0728 [Lysobacter enzymogenes]